MKLSDARTIQAYSDHASRFAAGGVPKRSANALNMLSAKLTPGSRVLDLGCGSGWAGEAMTRLGLDVYALDGCAALARMASTKLPRPARVMLFEQLDFVDQFDAVFACDVLQHVPKPALPYILDLIAQSLRPGGLMYGCFMCGEDEMRDSAGRYFARYGADEVLNLFNNSETLAFSSMRTESALNDAGSSQIYFGVFASRRATRHS